MNAFSALASGIRRKKISAVQVAESTFNRSLGEMKITINGKGYVAKNITPGVYKEVQHMLHNNYGGKLIKYLERINGGPLQTIEVHNSEEYGEDNNPEYVGIDKLHDFLEKALSEPRQETNVIPGGVGDKTNLKDLNENQLEKGVKEEIHDHGLSEEQALDIAADEIKLNPKEYLD